MESPNNITLDQTSTAKALGITSTTLWRWVKLGYIKPIKIGGRNYYCNSDIEKIINNGTNPILQQENCVQEKISNEISEHRGPKLAQFTIKWIDFSELHLAYDGYSLTLCGEFKYCISNQIKRYDTLSLGEEIYTENMSYIAKHGTFKYPQTALFVDIKPEYRINTLMGCSHKVSNLIWCRLCDIPSVPVFSKNHNECLAIKDINNKADVIEFLYKIKGFDIYKTSDYNDLVFRKTTDLVFHFPIMYDWYDYYWLPFTADNLMDGSLNIGGYDPVGYWQDTLCYGGKELHDRFISFIELFPSLRLSKFPMLEYIQDRKRDDDTKRINAMTKFLEYYAKKKPRQIFNKPSKPITLQMFGYGKV